MIVHRTLVIKYPLKKLSEEERETLFKLLSRLDALGNLYARGYEVESPDIQRRFISGFKYFKDELKFSTPPKRWFCKVHPVLDIGIRVTSEKDRGDGVFIDLSNGILRLRGFIYRRAIIVPLSDSVVKYIKDRLSEGAKAKIARVWIEKNKLCIGIVFERNVEVRSDFTNILVIDINSWKHGIVWGLIKDSRIVSRGVERPNLRYIDNLYREILKLERKLGNLRRLGLKHTEEYRRLRLKAKSKRSKIYRYLRDYVNKLVHRLIRKAMKHSTRIVVDYVLKESRRELLEEKLPRGLVKLYLLYLPRFINLLENQAKWCGIPIEFKRLPSTMCPKCGRELVQLEGRVMICDKCGFKANRDEVPIHWVLKTLHPYSKSRIQELEEVYGSSASQVGFRS